MIFKVKVSTIYHCSLDRAFKTPMLCDLTKVHTGYGLSPRVTHTTDDTDWGSIGSSKKVFVAPSIAQKGGFAFIDRVLERVENDYWKIQIDTFQSWMAGFIQFVGIWRTSQIEEGQVLVKYEYELHADVWIFYPWNWLFANLFWKVYMRRVLENVKTMAYAKEPYLY